MDLLPYSLLRSVYFFLPCLSCRAEDVGKDPTSNAVSIHLVVNSLVCLVNTHLLRICLILAMCLVIGIQAKDKGFSFWGK